MSNPKPIAFRPTETLEENLYNEVDERGVDISKVIKKRLEDLIFLKKMFQDGKVKVYKEKLSAYEEVRFDEI